MSVKISYNGSRYPRTVSLRGGKKTSFLSDRKVIEIPDYDAYLLLTMNNRLTPETWEFNVVGVSVKEPIYTPSVAKEVAPEAPLHEENTIEKPKPTEFKKKKGKK